MKVIIELEFDSKPTNEDVQHYLKELISNGGVDWHAEDSLPYPNRFWFHMDSGHAWLCVPRELVKAVNFKPSTYSYKKNGYFYLEEDSDAPKFIKLIGRLENRAIITHDKREIPVIDIDDGVDSPIRNYARCQ